MPPSMQQPNLSHLQAAITLAQEALMVSNPNPRVGCVLVRDGLVIGQGHTQAAGGPHAEVMALRDAQQHGHSTQGATAYVTLEPCSHQGRTGPCCDALVNAGVRHVVAALTDPNPQVCGQGFAKLRQAGVQVDVLEPSHPIAVAARELNVGFHSRMLRKLPWVRMKAAISLDGKTALPDGRSQWITSEAARTDGHHWRARACAVMTGIGTVLQDNPMLNVRLPQVQRQPHLVIVDSTLQTPLNAKLWECARKLFIYTAVTDLHRHQPWIDRGATVIALPTSDAPMRSTATVDVPAMLRDLAQREVNELHLEAGQRLHGAFMQLGLVDELLVYLAPKVMGAGLDMAQWGPLSDLTQATALQFKAIDMVGPDLRVLARVTGRDIF